MFDCWDRSGLSYSFTACVANGVGEHLKWTEKWRSSAHIHVKRGLSSPRRAAGTIARRTVQCTVQFCCCFLIDRPSLQYNMCSSLLVSPAHSLWQIYENIWIIRIHRTQFDQTDTASVYNLNWTLPLCWFAKCSTRKSTFEYAQLYSKYCQIKHYIVQIVLI